MNVVLGLVADQFDKGLSKASKSLNRSAKNMQRVGKNLSLSVTAPLAAIGASSFKVAADFELSMAKVKAISGATGSEFANLEKQARDLGASTIFAASEVSALQLELSKLGFSAKDIQDSTGAILALAQATGEELGPTAEIVAKTLNQFGLDADRSGRVADVMAAAFSSSALDLEKFGSAMANAGPVAAQFGFSLQETTQLLGVLANNGIEGADAGTKLKMAFSAIAAEGGDVKNVFNALIGANADYTTAMDVVKKRAAILVPVLAGNRDESEKLAKALDESTGSAQRMAGIMDNTASGSMAALRSAVESAQISLGQALAPAITTVANFVADMARKFAALEPETKKVIVVVGGLAAAAGPLATALGAILSPVGLIATGIAGLVVVFAPLVKQFTDLASKTQTLEGATRELNSRIGEQSAEVSVLFTQLKLAATAERDRTGAVDEIQSKYGAYLGNLDLNTASLREIEKAEIAVKGAIKDRVREQIRAEAQQAQTEALTDAETRLFEAGFSASEISSVTESIRRQINQVIDGSLSSSDFGTRVRNIVLDFGPEFRDAFVDGVGTGFGDTVIKEIERTSRSLRVVDKALDKFREDDPPPIVPTKGEEGLEKTNAELEELQRQLAAAQAELARFQQQGEKGSSTPEKITPFGTILDPDMFSGDDQFFSNLTDQINELQTAIAGTENFNPFGELTALQEAEARLSSLKSLFERLPESLQTSAEGVVLFNKILSEQEGLEVMQSQLNKVAEKTELVNTVSQAVGTGVGNAFGQLADNAREGGNAVAAMALEIIAAATAAALAGAIQLAFAPSADNIATGGLAAPIKAATLTAAVGALFSAIPAFAQGGMVLGPQLALVGDNPSGREAIIPFERMGEFINMVGGGRSSNVNVSGRIDGTTIVLANERATRNRGR